MILCIMMDRRDNYKCLSGQLSFDDFQEDKPPYTFCEEWLRKNSLSNFEFFFF